MPLPHRGEDGRIHAPSLATIDTPEPSMLDAALTYASFCWPVFPLRPLSKLPATAHGFHDASTDADQIHAWWTEQPDAGIGLDCRGFVVLDVDVKPGKRGDVELVDLVQAHGSIGWTLQASTPSGGMHFYFRAEGVRRTIGKLAPSIDVLGAGGFVVAPPTRLPAGSYRWLADGAPFHEPAPWLLERMRALSAEDTGVPIPATAIRGRWGSADDIGRRVDRALAYLDRMPPAIAGAGGHDATWRAALVLVRGFELPADVALDCLRYFSSRCSPPWTEAELRHKVDTAYRAQVPAGYLDGAR